MSFKSPVNKGGTEPFHSYAFTPKCTIIIVEGRGQNVLTFWVQLLRLRPPFWFLGVKDFKYKLISTGCPKWFSLLICNPHFRLVQASQIHIWLQRMIGIGLVLLYVTTFRTNFWIPSFKIEMFLRNVTECFVLWHMSKNWLYF